MPNVQTEGTTEPSYWISAVIIQLIHCQQLPQWQQQQLGMRPRNCGKRHIQSNAYFTSSLLTRFSTWFSLVNISRFVSFISVCNVSSDVAICSTALVRRITAAAASSLRRENPNSPIAATLMDAPAIAANTSITALCWCYLYSSSKAAPALWSLRAAHQSAFVMQLRFQPLYFHCLNL
jgi:hypothetical protein